VAGSPYDGSLYVGSSYFGSLYECSPYEGSLGCCPASGAAGGYGDWES
jgi:hypothetical protein